MKINFLSFFSILYSFIVPITSSFKTCNVLTLGGGGSFGAVEVGILKDMLEKNIISGEFDVITGISAGGLNAAFLSYGDNIKDNIDELEKLYKNVNTRNIYKPNFIFRILKDWSIFNNNPLEKTICKLIKDKKGSENRPITLIGSTNINSQKLDIFRYDKLPVKDQVDVLMGTSAIPILFKPRKINDCLYVDGGTIENEIIYQVLDAYEADYYHFTFVCATNKEKMNLKINNIIDYIKCVSTLLVNNYVYDIAKIKNTYFDCKRGKIDICYPTDPELMKYSFLNFNNGKEILELSKKNYSIETINFC